MKKPIFCGVATALITPMTKNGVDYDGFLKLIESQILSGANALIVAGTTGEPCTLTYREYEDLIKSAVKKVNGRVPLIAGCGSNSTEIAAKKAKTSMNAGADGLLIVTPYYNKCTQNGLFCHYKKIAEESRAPFIVYSVPSRTGVKVLPETVKKLTEIDGMVGFKDAAGNLLTTYETLKLIKNDVALYSGDDALNLDIYKLGGAGAISVTSNIFLKETLFVFDEYKKGNVKAAELMQKRLEEINRALFIEVNPIPVKAAAEYLGICSSYARLPLTPIENEHLKILISAIENLRGNDL